MWPFPENSLGEFGIIGNEFYMSILPSRKVAATFVGVFLIGAVVGGLFVTAFQDMRLSQFLVRTGDPKSMASRINQKYVTEYHLTPDEMTKIAPLTAEMTQQLYVTRRKFGVDIIATLDDYHRKIGEQMLPEHRDAFDQANVERRKRMSAVLLLDPTPADTGAK
jgi:hypothetical protein